MSKCLSSKCSGAFTSRKKFQFLEVKDREQAEMLEKNLATVELNTKLFCIEFFEMKNSKQVVILKESESETLVCISSQSFLPS